MIFQKYLFLRVPGYTQKNDAMNTHEYAYNYTKQQEIFKHMYSWFCEYFVCSKPSSSHSFQQHVLPFFVVVDLLSLKNKKDINKVDIVVLVLKEFKPFIGVWRIPF